MMITENTPAMLRSAVNMKKELRPIPLEEAKARFPAISGYVANHMSDRYRMVRTDELLERLLDRGYLITKAAQDAAKKRDPHTVRHCVTLVHSKALAEPDFREGVPTLLLWNSHNGRTVARMMSGFYRFVCANGLIVGTTEQDFAFRHMARPLEQLPAALELIQERQQLAITCMRNWQQVELTERKVISFAEKAAQLRFGEQAAGSYNRDAILSTRRADDEGNNLWRVMNRVQENLLRGGIEGRSANGRKVTSRDAKNLTLDLEFNRGLWQLADEYAKAA